MLARATLSACVQCRALIGAYLLCCWCAVTALCGAVLCLRSEENKEIQEGSPTNNSIVGNYRLRAAEVGEYTEGVLRSTRVYLFC